MGEETKVTKKINSWKMAEEGSVKAEGNIVMVSGTPHASKDINLNQPAH